MSPDAMSTGSMVPARVLIACCGNPVAGDDALGPLAAAALRARGLPPGVALIDVGDRAVALVDHLPGRDALILVDAVAHPTAPAGTLIDAEWREIRDAIVFSSSPASTHGLGVAAELALAETLGILPPLVRIVGLAIEGTAPGQPPGDMIRAGLRRFVDHIWTAAQRTEHSSARR
jgi:hydrogenase maturation protease